MSAWSVSVEGATWGTVPTVSILAERKCGRQERFEASLWPAGWRILRVGLDLPASVKREAMRLAKEVWGEE